MSKKITYNHEVTILRGDDLDTFENEFYEFTNDLSDFENMKIVKVGRDDNGGYYAVVQTTTTSSIIVI